MKRNKPVGLHNWIRESNLIEGIDNVRSEEVTTYRAFLDLKQVRIPDLCNLVRVIEPHARLRNIFGMNVTIGGNSGYPGGLDLMFKLDSILWDVKERTKNPYQTHCEYEILHPFTDGNGRSGRALWLWAMDNNTERSFLHEFYYQSLDAARIKS